MSHRNRNNANGEPVNIGSWIVTIIMLFVFWPLGILMLISRLKEAARYGNSTYRAPAQGARPDAAPAPRAAPMTAPKAAPAVEPARAEPKAETPKAGASGSFSSRAYAQLAKEQKTSKSASTLMLIFALVGLFIGGVISADTIGGLLSGYTSSMADFFVGLFFALGGGAMLFVRQFLPRRTKLRRRYLAVIGERTSVTVAELSLSLGRSSEKVYKELQDMIDDGYFGPGAYVDASLDMLVIDGSAVAGLYEQKPVTKEDTQASISEYDRILRELRTLNDKIEDAAISYKIERIEATSAKIFSAVQENPEKLPQIRRFMSYYLPTTLKLLRSYATLERQGVQGGNIASTKDSINNVLSKLATGFDQQLDQLFRVDAIDIGADIEVLENMMAQDGLSGAGPLSQTSTGEFF